MTRTSHDPKSGPNTRRTWFITGASSGIGLELAHAAAGRGDNVTAIARSERNLQRLNDAYADRVVVRAADVADPAALRAAVESTVATFGRIDVVANNAGFGLFGAVEESTDGQARAIFDTNVFGVLNVLRATLPVLRAQGSGHILQGSSYYGQVAHPGVGLLAATKYAVEGLTDALVGELSPLGITVTLVEPGPTATAFLDNLDLAETISDYDSTVREVQKSIGELPPSAFNSPARVAAAIIEAVDAPAPPLRLATGTHAVSEMRAALRSRLAELDAWEHLSASVDD
ncbi:SDR family NAD(P)-dependent oxidoreductase [Mycolicibacterium sp. 018/SC-01/001]|uniref:SDR family NAD(P)-dependent oxidoreductase n=1 Tax=Mycolicibacterium sp. 018/SC-01/001 TaxID=2592069 RepID=UPI00117D4EFC|nr:SDR family NAD(P)-dependent oxidoreductase [Mycolicibacterium sp. 018/SC-01/001]TRW88027.1 SDR family NAD(P)-dependent oxidoreductase [Mycolicibacterium sp. 018/SC-01/001]